MAFFFVFKRKLYLCNWNIMLKKMANKDLNRIKVVLAEQKRTAKWLAEPAYG